ncbi:putative RND efflux membrane fusion protein [Microcystis aeruginosa NIES-98]|nr:putative RND efflux membrane fusion protein [Microcystis aeruginosa NIES-98]
MKVVSLRSQATGQLLNLVVDVGDEVQLGQILAHVDDRLLATVVRQEKSALSALEAELARARIEVSNAEIEVERLQLQYQQAKNDGERLQKLALEGAIPLQQGETAQTTAAVALKAVNSARSRIKVEEQVVAAIIGRIAAQKSVIAQEQQRQAYAILKSPATGIVIEKLKEPGDLVSIGDEVLKIGDFQQVKVVVLLSELDLKTINLGQTVNVSLDAFGERNFSGRINRIFPLSQGTARRIPVEITLPNGDGLIKGGLLARVRFNNNSAAQVIVPETAIVSQGESPAIFVLSESNSQVQKRPVRLGQALDGQVEIITGLEPGERFVVNSSKPLQNGEKVRVSILSNP